jgi:hypothetical protein
MHDVFRVHVFDCRQGLTEEFVCLSLANSLMFVLVGEESAIFGQLHDHVDFAFLNESVPQFDDMRVVDSCMQVDFSFK